MSRPTIADLEAILDREEQVEIPEEPDTGSAKGGGKAGSGWMEFFQKAIQKHGRAS